MSNFLRCHQARPVMKTRLAIAGVALPSPWDNPLSPRHRGEEGPVALIITTLRITPLIKVRKYDCLNYQEKSTRCRVELQREESLHLISNWSKLDQCCSFKKSIYVLTTFFFFCNCRYESHLSL